MALISVIVHNWCRSFLLPLFIKSYCRQDFKDVTLEMIIIDDNSPTEDNFEQYLRLALNTVDIKDNLWFRIHAFRNKHSTMNSGWSANVGVKQSRGDILIFNHTDIFPMHKNTLGLICNRHQEYNAGNKDNPNMLFLTSATLTNDKTDFIPDCNGGTPWACAISRKLFYKIGGFDERFQGYGHEDADFGWRLIYGQKELGCTHIYDPNIVFVHLQQSNMISRPPASNPKNSDVVNENITKNHRWVVNPNGWGNSNKLEEILEFG